MIKRLLVPLFFVFFSLQLTFAEGVDVQKISQIPHPRILLLKGEEKAIKAAISNDSTWRKMHNAILTASDEIIGRPELKRELQGFRLLDVSRDCLRRLFFLSYAYRMTGDEKYFVAAEKVMFTVSAFEDWNPKHYLDVAEMAMAVSIGYDWLYEQLSPNSRSIIENALITKGLSPSFAYRDGEDPIYLRTNNWSQVCNAGMSYAALALSEINPALSKIALDRSVKSIKLPMGAYGPDGAYTEGYMYWGYGTMFNLLLLDAFDKVGVTAININDFPGFAKTSTYLLNMTGTSGESFDYMDCIPNSILNTSQFWFAQHLKDPSILWVEKSYLQGDRFLRLTDGNGVPISAEEKQKDKFKLFANDRTLPALMIWGKDVRLDKVQAPKEVNYVGQGETPVCLMRSSWQDPNAIYIGFKGGSAGISHGHMDVGSFVLDADGVRWASDLGMQSYFSLESKGVDLWNMRQNSTRWSAFRYNNLAHNTLAVNGGLQDVRGTAKIDKSGFDPNFSFAISDLSTVYKDQLKSVKRGVAIVNKKIAVVQDEFESNAKSDTVRWTVVTGATVSIKDNQTILLQKEGKTMLVKFDSNLKLHLKQWSAQSKNSFDISNEGKTLFGYEVILPPNTKNSVSVKFIPGSSKGEKGLYKGSLNEWK